MPAKTHPRHPSFDTEPINEAPTWGKGAVFLCSAQERQKAPISYPMSPQTWNFFRQTLSLLETGFGRGAKHEGLKLSYPTLPASAASHDVCAEGIGGQSEQRIRRRLGHDIDHKAAGAEVSLLAVAEIKGVFFAEVFQA